MTVSFNAYNYPMHMKALTSCDITDVVANAGQPTVLFVEDVKSIYMELTPLLSLTSTVQKMLIQ